LFLFESEEKDTAGINKGKKTICSSTPSEGSLPVRAYKGRAGFLFYREMRERGRKGKKKHLVQMKKGREVPKEGQLRCVVLAERERLGDPTLLQQKKKRKMGGGSSRRVGEGKKKGRPPTDGGISLRFFLGKGESFKASSSSSRVVLEKKKAQRFFFTHRERRGGEGGGSRKSISRREKEGEKVEEKSLY